MTFIFIAQILLGLLLYGRGWWHAAFAPGTEDEPNQKQLFITVRGYTINLTSSSNIGLGLAFIVIGIVGLVIL